MLKAPLDFTTAKTNMLTQQFRAWHVLDDKVLQLFSDIPRERFVPAQHKELAYADCTLPTQHGHIMSPTLQARALQALDIQPHDVVLEIGTINGFMTTLLAKLAEKVYSLSSDDAERKSASNTLSELGLNNVEFIVSETMNLPTHAPYNVIMVNGSLPEVPQSLKEQLAVGGRLFIITGDSPLMTANLIVRQTSTKWEITPLFETDFPRLKNFKPEQRFVF